MGKHLFDNLRERLREAFELGQKAEGIERKLYVSILCQENAGCGIREKRKKEMSSLIMRMM